MNNRTIHDVIENSLASSEKVKEVRKMLQDGVDVNFRNIANGNTPLIAAALWNEPEIMEALLALNPAIEAKNNNHKTALYIAVRNGNENCVKILIISGARQQWGTGHQAENVWSTAMEFSQVPILTFLINLDVTIYFPNELRLYLFKKDLRNENVKVCLNALYQQQKNIIDQSFELPCLSVDELTSIARQLIMLSILSAYSNTLVNEVLNEPLIPTLSEMINEYRSPLDHLCAFIAEDTRSVWVKTIKEILGNEKLDEETRINALKTTLNGNKFCKDMTPEMIIPRLRQYGLSVDIANTFAFDDAAILIDSIDQAICRSTGLVIEKRAYDWLNDLEVKLIQSPKFSVFFNKRLPQHAMDILDLIHDARKQNLKWSEAAEKVKSIVALTQNIQDETRELYISFSV